MRGSWSRWGEIGVFLLLRSGVTGPPLNPTVRPLNNCEEQIPQVSPAKKPANSSIPDADRGLLVIDVANPAAPVGVGFYDTPGSARGVFEAGGIVFVADGDGGLYLLRFTGGDRRLYLPLVVR